MKKKTLVLCELHEEDRLAATVVHMGLCAECVEAITNLRANLDGRGKAGKRVTGKRVKGNTTTSTSTSPKSHRTPPARKLHAKCGREIDPRGWSKHVAACKGKGSAKGSAKVKNGRRKAANGRRKK